MTVIALDDALLHIEVSLPLHSVTETAIACPTSPDVVT